MLAKKLTPLLRQYLDIKQQYNDCLIFFRLGDFYELFFEDAEIAAKTLSITLTKRGQVDGEDIPMCGVPHHHGDSYLAKLLKNGFKVAICEQVETPEESKKRGYKEIIKRKVVRIATPGTLTEEKELISPENNYLMSVTFFNTHFNIVYADISTGEISIKKALRENEVLDIIESILPAEIILPKTQEYEFILKTNKKNLVTFIDNKYLDIESASNYFEKTYRFDKKLSLTNFSIDEKISLGATIKYIAFTQNEKTPVMLFPQRNKIDDYLEIDNASKRNLEIVKNLNGDSEGSLFNSLNFTMTATGSRKLLNDLSNPLSNLNSINKRLDLVNFFCDNFDDLNHIVAKSINNFPDISRSLSRLSLGRGGPKDLFCILNGLKKSIELCEVVNDKVEDLNDDFFLKFLKNTKGNKDVQKIVLTLESALGENLPLLSRDGNFIKAGFDAKLDEVRKFRDEAKALIIKEEESEKKISGINNLKIKYNSFLGYFIDISSSNNDKLKNTDLHYIHRQTLKNSFRYTTKNLTSISEKILNANFESLELEIEIYNKLVSLLLQSSGNILNIANLVARMDVAISWSNYAKKYGAVRPELNDSFEFIIKKGRHPSVEKTHTESFIANNCILNEKDNNLFRLITGPNMSGKSTYLRQNALILIIAQAGGYCPAEQVNIGVCDKLFCRVGSGDELAKGNSTFMVEMLETANILNSATNRSLVILDEIGRGTSTYDGMSLAWATVEFLMQNIKCKTLFATHYNQLAALEKNYILLKLNTFRVKKWKNELIFLHQLIEGVAESSYGIEVAKMAGLPEVVVIKAREVLNNLENGLGVENINSDIQTIDINREKKNTMLKLLEDQIISLNLNNLTPIEALNFLKEIKDKLEE